MRKVEYGLLLVVALLILGQFVLSLLANYATRYVPPIIVKHPALLWILIGFTLISMIVISIVQYSLDKRDGNARPNDGLAEGSNSITSMSHTHDVFVSYSHKNAAWVHNTLVPRLKNHGFSVFTDADFQAGGFGVSQMEEGVRQSKRVLAVFTPDYFRSDWATLENVMVQLLDPAARKRKLIPVLLEDTNIPLRLHGIHYRDLRSGEEAEWQKLIQDLM